MLHKHDRPSQRFPATLVSSASFSSRCGTIRRRLQRIFSFSWSQWCAQETTESGMETGLTFKLSNQHCCYWKKKRTSIQRFRLISLWIALPRAQYIMFVGGIWHVTNSCWIMLFLIKLLRSLEVLSDWRIISESPELRYSRLNKVVKLCQTYMKCLTHAQWQQLSNSTECQKVSAILILELIFRIICPCHRQAIGLGIYVRGCQGQNCFRMQLERGWKKVEGMSWVLFQETCWDGVYWKGGKHNEQWDIGAALYVEKPIQNEQKTCDCEPLPWNKPASGTLGTLYTSVWGVWIEKGGW